MSYQESGNLPEQMAPHNVEAEESVLGSILMNQEALEEVRHFLEKDHFYIVRHGWIYKAILDLHARHDPIDYLTVVAELETVPDRLEEIGGAAYVLNLINKTPTALHVEGYGRIVERTGIRRQLITAAGWVAQAAHDQEVDIQEVLLRAEGAIAEVVKGYGGRKKEADLHDVYNWLMERTEQYQAAPGELRGLSLGFRALDKLIGGIDSDEYIILAANSGMGKSTLARQMMFGMVESGGEIIYITIEQSKKDVLNGIACANAGIESKKWRAGRLTNEEVERHDVAAAEVARASDQFHVLPGSASVMDVKAAINSYRTTDQCVVFLDTLNTMTPTTGNKTYDQVTRMSAGLLGLTTDMDIPLIALVQLNRNLFNRADKRPTQADIRDSGQIYEHARLLLTLHREGYYDDEVKDPNGAVVSVMKRSLYGAGGGRDNATLEWRAEIPAFYARSYITDEEQSSS